MSDIRLPAKQAFVRDGLKFAELFAFFQKALAEEGFVGIEIIPRLSLCDLTVYITRLKAILSDKGRIVRELISLVRLRYNDNISVSFDRVQDRGLSAAAQVESVRFKLLSGLPVRKAGYSVVKFIMDAGAEGCEVVISGKIRGQRAKSMKFVEGNMIHSGKSVEDHVDKAKCHVLLRQGVLGVQVKINKPSERCKFSDGRLVIHPNRVVIHEPKSEEGSDKRPAVELKEEAYKNILPFLEAFYLAHMEAIGQVPTLLPAQKI